ncbi:hypothetical protein LB505_005264 [Fusarium chuoi]|nr:hypothetical protein LB505_005264 [Fusarium chuoi]
MNAAAKITGQQPKPKPEEATPVPKVVEPPHKKTINDYVILEEMGQGATLPSDVFLSIRGLETESWALYPWKFMSWSTFANLSYFIPTSSRCKDSLRMT